MFDIEMFMQMEIPLALFYLVPFLLAMRLGMWRDGVELNQLSLGDWVLIVCPVVNIVLAHFYVVVLIFRVIRVLFKWVVKIDSLKRVCQALTRSI